MTFRRKDEQIDHDAGLPDSISWMDFISGVDRRLLPQIIMYHGRVLQTTLFYGLTIVGNISR
jgi:hypothetical protein